LKADSRLCLLNFKGKTLSSSFFLIKLIPNLVTLSALIIGVSAIRFAFDGFWEGAIWCVFIAGMLDIADGKLARALKVTSPFGVELDSFADLVNFGVTPAVVLYLWHSQCDVSGADKLILWLSSCFYIACAALRLAKFNVTALDASQHSGRFFLGVPSPMGAMFTLIPIVINFKVGPMLGITLNDSVFLVPYILCVGVLMASRIPTLAVKFLRVPHEYVWLLCVGLVMFAMSIVLYPWYAMPTCALLYLCSLIVSPFFFFRRKKD
jgi:CDP-diacylglycerol---serine O-phosphatidyltransferase